MTLPLAALAPVIGATWPPHALRPHGPFLLAENTGGGSRVRAARLIDPTATGADVSDSHISQADAAMVALGQPALFMVLDGQTALDTSLDAQGYAIKDPTVAMIMATADLAAAPPKVTCFPTWPPLAIQDEIWAQGGIGADRLAIMGRVDGPKISLFGRVNDKPAGSAFVAIHDRIAMLHALEILPEGRRKGLARHMMRAAGDWAQQNGADQFSILVTCQNTPARALYASLGFEAVGQYWYRAKAS